MMWMICLFGGLGAMARYVLDVSIQRGWNRENRRTNRNFPLSTALNEVVSLIRQRRFTLALGYGIATVAVPLICVAAGFGIALLANPA